MQKIKKNLKFGALTKKENMFKSRPWELKTRRIRDIISVEATDLLVSFGCNFINIQPFIASITDFKWIADQTRFYYGTLSAASLGANTRRCVAFFNTRVGSLSTKHLFNLKAYLYRNIVSFNKLLVTSKFVNVIFPHLLVNEVFLEISNRLTADHLIEQIQKIEKFGSNPLRGHFVNRLEKFGLKNHHEGEKVNKLHSLQAFPSLAMKLRSNKNLINLRPISSCGGLFNLKKFIEGSFMGLIGCITLKHAREKKFIASTVGNLCNIATNIKDITEVFINRLSVKIKHFWFNNFSLVIEFDKVVTDKEQRRGITLHYYSSKFVEIPDFKIPVPTKSYLENGGVFWSFDGKINKVGISHNIGNWNINIV
jgi:hypothetical protein